MLHLLRGST